MVAQKRQLVLTQSILGMELKVFVKTCVVCCVLSAVATKTKRAKQRSLKQGKVASEGQFPYMAQIVRVLDINETSRKHSPDDLTEDDLAHLSTLSILNDICGASLIRQDWILTAGQCFPDGDEECEQLENDRTLVVIMGSLTSLDFTSGSSRRNIVKIVRHVNYQHVVTGDLVAVSDDIAVAQLNSKFKLNKFIQVVYIPKASYLHGQPLTSKIRKCVVMGFGTAEPEKGSQGSPLKFMEIFVVSSTDYNIANSSNVFVSAAGQDSSASQGDIGSAVVCKGRQFGLVSLVTVVDGTYVNLYTQVGQYQEFLSQAVPSMEFKVPQSAKAGGAKAHLDGGYLVVVVYFCWSSMYVDVK